MDTGKVHAWHIGSSQEMGVVKTVLIFLAWVRQTGTNSSIPESRSDDRLYDGCKGQMCPPLWCLLTNGFNVVNKDEFT